MTNKTMPERITVVQTSEHIFPDDLYVTELGAGSLLPRDLNEAEYIRADLVPAIAQVPTIDAGKWTVLAGLNDVQAKVIATIYGCEDGLELDDDVIAVCASESITEYPTLRREVDGLDGLYAANEIPAEHIISALPQLLAQ